MKNIHPLPSILTLGNFACGFVAIVLAARSMVEDKAIAMLPLHQGPADLIYFACGLIFFAMVFDVLDGKVARMTNSASRFGGELDSLSDVVSFGIAPAVILTTSWIRIEPDSARWWSLVLGFGFIFAACASLRLARYNVEMDETAKNYFLGMPTPAAAGAVVSMFLLIHQPWLHEPLAGFLGDILLIKLMAIYMLIMGLMMVTRVRYVHLTNILLVERKRFMHFVIALFCLTLLLQWPIIVIAIGFNCYALSGIVGELIIRMRRHRRQETSGKRGKNIIKLPTGDTSDPDDDRNVSGE
ncbi:MAG: phosphatidylcholine/phosphatidylserine synthase [Planctomycetes bacterium]|nr:phosphatidylcholine/phosphatidylserine synthase [Planctomycetota bacterium]